MNRRFISVCLLSAVIFWSIVPTAFAIEPKYMQFRQITVDGDDVDWNGIDSSVFVSQIMRQNGHLVIIDDNTFTPGNVSVKTGDAIVWKNQDENTAPNINKLHQIALGVEAPITWTSDALDEDDMDFYIPEVAANYSYSTSKTNFLGHDEGNISVVESEWKQFYYAVSFASSVSFLWISLTISNISDEIGDDLYLKGFDIIMDDFADGSIQGENAIRVSKVGDEYQAYDMYYASGYLSTDTSDGAKSDILMGYSHFIPETDAPVDYLGDIFFELRIPINSGEIRDIGASVGQSIGIQMVVKVSDQEQDDNATTIGVRDHYRGGGYPIKTPYADDEIDKLSLDPSKFIKINLLGDDLLLVIQTIFEEAWIFVVGTIASAFGLIFGGIIVGKRKINHLTPQCIDGICDINQ